MNVLLVDDHTIVRDGIALILKQLDADINVIHAGGFQESLTSLSRETIDLILLDLGLPDMPGLDAIKSMREKEPDTPIIVLSATQDRETVLRAIEYGAMGYVPKTYSSDLLISILRNLLIHKGIYIPPEPMLTANQTHVREQLEKVTTPQDLGLTPRQAEVLYFLLQGKQNRWIARRLGIEAATVKVHLNPILRALKATNRSEAIVAASKLNLVFQQIPE